MHRTPSHGLPASRTKAMGFVVVLALHGSFIWGLNAGLGRKLLESPSIVVFAQLISEVRTAPVPPPAPPKVMVAPKAAVVLGYNWLVRRNKALLEQIGAFGSDLHAVLLASPQQCPAN